MTATRIGDAIDRLFAFFDAALPGIGVLDGAVASMQYPNDWLVVGGDGPIDAEEEAATSTQTWEGAGLGAKSRLETVTVRCACGAWDGSGTKKAMRDRALATLAAAVNAVRADPGLGGFTYGAAEPLTETELHYTDNTGGVGAALVFRVAIPVRI